jgi:hypothetical protein
MLLWPRALLAAGGDAVRIVASARFVALSRSSTIRKAQIPEKTIDLEAVWVYIHECHPQGRIAESGLVRLSAVSRISFERTLIG